jgi:uncharacterized protein involved in type VI secretion and phage assembly
MNRARQLFEIPLPGLIFGGHLAEVTSLNDPDNLARVQIRLLSSDGVNDHDGPLWARVALPFAGNNRGAFFIPDVGDEVFVIFVQGDSRFPVIVGGLWNGDDTAPGQISGGVNRKKVLRSKNGVKVTLDDQNGQEAFIAETPGGQKVTLKDGPGSVKIEDGNGNSITLESSGVTVNASATVTINAAQVKVSAGMITADAAMAKFSGVVQCDVLIATTVVATTYTPGAGNIW